MPYEDVFDRIAVQAWSEAKVQAWKVRTTSPNDYLNRFPAPGERQAVGAFEGNEAQAFKQRLTNFQSKGWPLSPCWGIFSLVLPNRTGQQCAAHYRKTSSSNANAGSGQQQSSKAATAAAAAACICHHHRQLQALWAAPAAQRLASRVDAWLNAAGLLAAPKSQAKASAQPRSSSGSTALGNTPASHTGQKSSNALRQRATVNPAGVCASLGFMIQRSTAITSDQVLTPFTRASQSPSLAKAQPTSGSTSASSTAFPGVPAAAQATEEGDTRKRSSVALEDQPLAMRMHMPLQPHHTSSVASHTAAPNPIRRSSLGPAHPPGSANMDAASAGAASQVGLEQLQPVSRGARPAKKPKFVHHLQPAKQQQDGTACSAALQPITNQPGHIQAATAHLPAQELSCDDSSDDEDFVEGSLRHGIQQDSVRVLPATTVQQPSAQRKRRSLMRSTKKSDALEDKGDMEFGHQVTSIKILHLRQLPGLAPRNVQPYAPPPTPTSLGASSQAASQTRSVQYTDSLLAFDLARAGSNFLGVLMNPPVVSTSGNGSVGITSTQLAAMQLGSLKLVASGLLCVWAAKDCLAEVARCMSMWGFKYVENLTWLQLSPNNHPLRLPSPAVAASHLTLLIGRKGNSDLELRHQRCPDVVIAPVPAHGLVPEAVYETIETMLPDATPALKDPDNHAPRLLELRWGGAEASARNGWSTVVQKAASCTGDPCS